jgi:hypothetical protein
MRSLFFTLTFGLSIFAGSAFASPAAATMPGTLSPFKAEWCGPNQSTTRSLPDSFRIANVCFGSSTYINEPSRAVLLVYADQRTELYVESDWRTVDLLTLKISLIGPVNSDLAGVGSATLSIDRNGEVESLVGWTATQVPFSSHRPDAQ